MLASYSGDDSEEAKAKIQELKVSLEEAKENLKETEYEKYISDTQQMLDELVLEYSELLNMRLDNLDALVEGVIAEVNADAGVIGDTIRETADSVGYTLSDSMQTIWTETADGTNDVITMYGEKFSSAQTTTNNALSTINTNLQNVIAQLNKIAGTNIESDDTTSSSNSKEANANTKPNTDNSSNNKKENTASSSNTRSEKDYYGVALAIVRGDMGWGNGADRKNRLKTKGFDSDKAQSIVNKVWSDGYVHNGTWKGKYHGITDLAPYHYNKFAQGVYNLNRSQLAWTQENNPEMIIRPSDGAILTPLAKGDSVLNARASSNIWNMANSPTDFIRDNLGIGNMNVPNAQNVNSTYTQHIDNVIFDFKNVKNYDEMLTQMQQDKSFEKLIMAMTIDRIAGKSSLAKGKAIR